MIITKQQALDGIASGNMVYDGRTCDGSMYPDGCLYWILQDNANQDVHHVKVGDDEPMIGCMACGHIVEVEPDARGCGCHCPICQATL